MARRNAKSLQFKNTADMARLPYFELTRDGQLRTAARILREFPIIDIHTHLGYSYFFSPPIPLKARNRSSHFKMPEHIALNLDQFYYRELGEKIREKFFWDVIYTLFSSPPEVYHHTIPNLLADMDNLGIRHSVILPIELPGSSNSPYMLESCRGEKRIIPFCSVNPFLFGKRKRLRSLIRDGARGMKFHPEFQFMAPDAPDAMRLFEICAEENIPVLTHSGSTGMETAWMQDNSRLFRFEKPIRAFPDTPFVLGHAGFHEVDRAIALCDKYPNAYLEMSGQPCHNVAHIIASLAPEKILFGSDWSWYNPAAPLACILLATEGKPAIRRKILYENAAKILKI